MNISKTLLILTVGILLSLTSTAIAQDKDYLPSEGGFHFDLRAMTLLDGNVLVLERDDDPKDIETTSTGNFGLGAGVDAKLGYLINGHHDVGGIISFNNSGTVTVLDPEDNNKDEIKTQMSENNFSLAAYYTYNWQCKGWVMPYLGPVAGFEVAYTEFEDIDDSDSKVSTTLVSPFVGAEVGVKLFVMKNVAFDIAGTSTMGPAVRSTSFGDDRDNDDWGGINMDVAAKAGLSVYF